MLRAREARVASDVEGARGAAAGLAVEDDVGVARELVETIRELAERDVARAIDVACIPFVRLADVDRDRVADLRHLVQVRGIAELVVVDESCNCGMRIVLLLEPQRSKRAP